MTHETLVLLLRCLDSQQLGVGAPDFEVMAVAAIKARRELVEAIENITPDQ